MTVLTFQRVSVLVPRGHDVVQALRDVSFDAAGGRLTGIYEAATGLGTATIPQILLRQRRPDGGRVLCHGRSLYSWRGRTRVAAAIPGAFLLEAARDLLEYVTFAGLKRHTWRAAELLAFEALDWVGIRHLAAVRPSALSSTERVFGALAAAVLARPDVLVAQDPAAGFGAERQQILALLRRYAEENDAVALTTVRQMTDLHQCHERLLIDKGRLVQASPQVKILVPADP